ncbi:RCC1 domain-containing protein [Anaeromyxobacter oryzae]|uniref:Regulator of chromosome condensation RCC1 n=1 Tax=Anaeromyxobacter oryzae TaxID=2918170 RepID=A0ABM7WVL3_9BACT|nr:hypothetical protein [Anaeromyxobacter oryzae]BDG03546.1 hypothetical protein AMOR_25420 [Anaeromyxobacter oryzae]
MTRLSTVVLAVVAAAAGGGCQRTVYDAEGVPRLGALLCADPGTHACEALGVCARDDDAQRCEADCHPCATDVPGARAICVANACAYECAAGSLKCATGCCRAAAITAGGDHACAVTAGTGELLCWGANNDGQLGIGDPSGADQPTPVKVALPAPVVSASAGTAHSCAVVEGGAVYCWGRASSFLSGAEYVFSPEEVAALSGATAIAAGGGHTCALRGGGAVRCAGAWNPGGLAGEPVASGATAIATGDGFSCALVAGAVQCWGANDHGQLGATGDVAQPATIALAGPVSILALGSDQGCAATADPTAPVRCWGLRIGLSSDLATPYALDDVRYSVSALAGGAAHGCALRAPASDGVECWGNTAASPVIGGTALVVGAPVRVAVASPASAIAAGLSHTCAIDGAGAVVCWGRGDRGQLGDGRKVDAEIPVAVVSR